jgi:hypothetical protein
VCLQREDPLQPFPSLSPQAKNTLFFFSLSRALARSMKRSHAEMEAAHPAAPAAAAAAAGPGPAMGPGGRGARIPVSARSPFVLRPVPDAVKRNVQQAVLELTFGDQRVDHRRCACLGDRG